MRKILLLLAISIAMSACSKDGRYTEKSAEIDTYKKIIAAYENKDFETMRTFYADSAKILYNVTEAEAQTVSQMMENIEKDETLFTKWEYDKNELEYEMIVTDKGETWVNFWSVWKTTLRSNGKTYTIPTSLTARFVDGKIVREYGYWDLSRLNSDIAQAQNAAISDTTKTVQP